MSTFHTGSAGSFPAIDDACAQLEQLIADTEKRLPGRPIALYPQAGNPAFLPEKKASESSASQGPGELALAALARRDALEEKLARDYSRILTVTGKLDYPWGAVAESTARTPLKTPPRKPMSPTGRLWRKFRDDPYQYFSDSKNPLLRGLRFLFRQKK